MEIEAKAAKLERVKWREDHNSFVAACPLVDSHRLAVSKIKTKCLGGCADAAISEFFAGVAQAADAPDLKSGDLNGLAGSTPAARTTFASGHDSGSLNAEVPESSNGKTPDFGSGNGGSIPSSGSNGHARPVNDLFSWKYKLSFVAKHVLTDPKFATYVQNESRENLHAGLIGTLREAIERPDNAPPPDLTPVEVEEDLDQMAGVLLDQYLPPPQLPAVAEPDNTALVVIDWEDHASALVANQEYLTHTPIIEGLCYAKTASLLVGGKHSGKTTNARTIALSVCRGLPVYGRNVLQGPVLYCASEDEVLVVRSELLRMGWNPADPLNLMKIGSKTLADPARLLDSIAIFASAKQAKLIILDMLFDFAGIRDEMSYAGTREAAGKVYDLAMRTDAHVMATHHSPKYLSGGATAETAALGSQGIAARFSPIILSRHWGADLYTIESTPPRDPRGKGIESVCVLLDENGMSRAGEPFRDSMRWRVMAPKVLDFISSVDPGQHHTVSALAEGMEINRPMMQTILYNLCREGKLEREKRGRGYKYFLPPAQGGLYNPD